MRLPTREDGHEHLYDIAVKRIDGKDATLGAYRGKVLLDVNVASQCGLTPQYEGLEQLCQDKRAQGLEMLDFPPADPRLLQAIETELAK